MCDGLGVGTPVGASDAGGTTGAIVCDGFTVCDGLGVGTGVGVEATSVTNCKYIGNWFSFPGAGECRVGLLLPSAANLKSNKRCV